MNSELSRGLRTGTTKIYETAQKTPIFSDPLVLFRAKSEEATRGQDATRTQKCLTFCCTYDICSHTQLAISDNYWDVNMFFDNNKIAALTACIDPWPFHLIYCQNINGMESGLKPIDATISPVHLVHLGGLRLIFASSRVISEQFWVVS